MDYQALIVAAHAAAEAKVNELVEDAKRRYPDRHYDHIGACGFAWVEVHLGRDPFINAMHKMAKASAFGDYDKRRYFGERQDYGSRAWQFWSPGNYHGQRVDIKEAAAAEFARVLREGGITKAYARSRLD